MRVLDVKKLCPAAAGTIFVSKTDAANKKQMG